VFAATDDPEVNAKIALICDRRNIPVNVANIPELCSFIVPSVMRRGGLTFNVSTGARNPAFARLIKEDLRRLYPATLARLLRYLDLYRKALLRTPAGPKRTRFLRSMVYDTDILNTLRTRGLKAAIHRLRAFFLKGAR
jgi:siroheme synthase-like protein